MKLKIAVLLLITSFSALARDNISIVGSSTVFPFSSAVAEHVGKTGKVKTPTVESTGTGGGFKLFCGGPGPDFPDIANASRQIKKIEVSACEGNNVKDIVEVKIGYDGIVLAQSKKNSAINFTRKEIYLALAKQIPDPACEECGKLVDNPYKTWVQINPSLPDTKIEVMGPPPTSGTRDAFSDLVLESGCSEYDWLKSWKKKNEEEFKKMCRTIREDGVYVEAGENDNLIVQKLSVKPGAFGIFGYSFLASNDDKLSASTIEGVSANPDTIADGIYPVSRPLFFYVKQSAIKSTLGIVEYVKEFTSESTWGDEGYLIDKGLVPMPQRERVQIREQVLNRLR